VEVSEIAGARSYDDVVAAYAPALLRLAVMLTGDPSDAEDLLQSTLLRTVRHAERVASMAAPAAYLRRVMLNEHLSHGRRLGRRVRTVSSEVTSYHPPVPSGADTVDSRDETWAWLAGLRPQQRAVLVLRYYEDLPDAEIAGVLGCSESTVRSHAFRGLASLRERLDASGGRSPS
jgi:RNA polymerase sigma-70 factor (sigma-E family)